MWLFHPIPINVFSIELRCSNKLNNKTDEEKIVRNISWERFTAKLHCLAGSLVAYRVYILDLTSYIHWLDNRKIIFFSEENKQNSREMKLKILWNCIIFEFYLYNPLKIQSKLKFRRNKINCVTTTQTKSSQNKCKQNVKPKNNQFCEFNCFFRPLSSKSIDTKEKTVFIIVYDWSSYVHCEYIYV